MILRSYSAARIYSPADQAEWLRMRLILWPEMDAEAQLVDMEAWLARPDTVVLVVPRQAQAQDAVTSSSSRNSPSQLAGFAEVGTRSVADSCESSPVAYLEGWFVDDDMRRQGVGTALIRAAEDWARGKGFQEFASDTQIANESSQTAHTALGFTEVDRVVVYRKVL